MFGRKSTPDWFFETSVHEEAISRLLYLIESRSAQALVNGPDGSGRSLCLSRFTEELCRQTDVRPLLVNASGLDRDALLETIASGLAIPVGNSGGRRSDLILRVQEDLIGRAHCGLRTVILIDDVHRSFTDVVPVVQFLAGISSRAWNMVSVVSASGTARIQGLSGLSSLSIPLTPLSEEESIHFVAAFLSDHEERAGRIHASAIPAVVQLSGRLPAQLLQICRLLLVVGETSPDLRIDDQIVQQVVREVTRRAVA